MQCPMCEKPIKIARALVDSNDNVVGLYCSKECAENDAWGPRFEPFSTRRATKTDRKMYDPT